MSDEKMAQALPDFAALAKTLGTPDATFDAWRDATADKHWKHFDLSALRIGYELGKAAHESRAQPASVAGGWVMVPLWKMRRAAQVIEDDGDEHGVGRDIRDMIAAAPQPPATAQEVCPTCGGSKVDPGGLPVCRDCGDDQ